MSFFPELRSQIQADLTFKASLVYRELDTCNNSDNQSRSSSETRLDCVGDIESIATFPESSFFVALFLLTLLNSQLAGQLQESRA